MEGKKKLPVGIEDFQLLRREDFYYIDKTAMIRDLLHAWGSVNLFTRPRRFGKSINMSMLRYFFEIGTDKSLFDGLEIAKETELCEKYMGQFPVVSISLKSIDGADFETALGMAVDVINEEARRLQFLAKSEKLTVAEKNLFQQLLKGDMSDATLKSSLRNLTELLEKHYGKKVILLIDEYDVPLAKANENDYYDDMIRLIRGMFLQALKTNSSVYFSVLTGCLRVSKESIFTGLNNTLIFSIMDVSFDEYFGFSDQEVRDILEYYELFDKYDVIREWYDGYQFGNVRVYNPWDIIRYLYDLNWNANALPKDYWSNTSGNHLVRTFIKEYGNNQTQAEIESLLAGETVTKEIREDLTYNTMYSSIDNIWSVLFTTGYLTLRGMPLGKRCALAIPNREVSNIFAEQIMDLFQEKIAKDTEVREDFCKTLEAGDAAALEKMFTDYLDDTISLQDTYVHKDRKENFYHGILLGIFAYHDGWRTKSNGEAGDGFADICIRVRKKDIGIIIEMKYAENGKFTEALEEAFRQIERENYIHELEKDDYHTIYKYGIACYKKRCRVKCEKMSIEPEDQALLSDQSGRSGTYIFVR